MFSTGHTKSQCKSFSATSSIKEEVLTEKLVGKRLYLLPLMIGDHILRTTKRNRFLNGPDAVAGINPKMPHRCTAEDLFEDIAEPARPSPGHVYFTLEPTDALDSVSRMDAYKNSSLCSVYLSSTIGHFMGSVYWWIQHFVVYVLLQSYYVYEKQQKQLLALPFGLPTSKVPLVVPFAMYLGLSLL